MRANCLHWVANTDKIYLLQVQLKGEDTNLFLKHAYSIRAHMSPALRPIHTERASVIPTAPVYRNTCQHVYASGVNATIDLHAFCSQCVVFIAVKLTARV